MAAQRHGTMEAVLRVALCALATCAGCGSDVRNNTDGEPAFGAGNAGADFCARLCACAICSDDERETCSDGMEGQARAATDAGCDNELQDMLACFAVGFECINGGVRIVGCDELSHTVDDCIDQAPSK